MTDAFIGHECTDKQNNNKNLQGKGGIVMSMKKADLGIALYVLAAFVNSYY